MLIGEGDKNNHASVISVFTKDCVILRGFLILADELTFDE